MPAPSSRRLCLVEQELGHALVAAHRERAAARRPGKHRLLVVDAVRLRLRLGLPIHAISGIGVGDRRNRARVEERLVAGDHLRRDLAFVRRLVREHGLAADVADRVDVRHVGAQLLVDRDVAALVDVDAGRLRVDLAAVGAAADRHQYGVEDLRLGAPSAFEA